MKDINFVYYQFMLKTFLLLSSILALNFVIFPQVKNDLMERGLKGNVRQINHYTAFRPQGPDWENSNTGRLSGISVFNRKGNLTVEIYIDGGLKECAVKKNLYTYDEKNRKKTMTFYESDRSAVFCDLTPPLFEENQTAYLDDKISLKTRTEYDYDRKGRPVRETIFEPDGEIIEKAGYEYNARSENVRITLTRYRNLISGRSGKPVAVTESRFSSRNGGKILESYYYEDGRPTIYGIHYLDKKRRQVRIEQYNLETDVENIITKRILTSSSKKYYDGTEEITEWTNYDDAGHLNGQNYTLSENDNILMSLTYRVGATAEAWQGGRERLSHYRYDPADRPEINQRLKYLSSFDRAAENSEWTAAGFTVIFYKFDAPGNLVRRSTLQKKNPADENPIRSFSRQDVIYYQ